MRKWILPEHIEDILPDEAERLEALRRALLDHFRGHGYRLVQPPLVEHLESLLTGTGRESSGEVTPSRRARPRERACRTVCWRPSRWCW